jgi:hypothetical protein
MSGSTGFDLYSPPPYTHVFLMRLELPNFPASS